MILKTLPNIFFLKRKKALILLIGIFHLVISAYSQDSGAGLTSYTPPSPNASALAKYANIPISLYTGTPQIDIPLADLSFQGGKVPVSLSYHASGVKVQDIASSCGLGWSLNSGGVITRIVRGLPDEDENGYCGANKAGEKLTQQSTPSIDYLIKVTREDLDAEPDLFYFNVMGLSGRFILDAAGNPVLLPYQDVLIKPAIGPLGGVSWVITDNKGYIYVFKDNDSFREKTSAKLEDENDTKWKSFTSSWYLSEVRSPSNQLLANFAYETVNEIKYKTYASISALGIRFYQLGAPDDPILINTDLYFRSLNRDLKVSAKYISKIQTSLGEISFNYDTRLDLINGKRLSSMTLVNTFGKQLIQRYIFNNNDYFISDPASGDGLTDDITHRLRLTSIERVSSTGKKSLYYQFGYNLNISLPPRNSSKYDHWGYFNNNQKATAIAEVPADKDIDGTYRVGANKDPDSERTKADILTSIINSTGGETKFIYQAHDCSDDAFDSKTVGGCRIWKVIVDDKNGHLITKEYKYIKEEAPTKSSGRIFGLPEYGIITYPPGPLCGGAGCADGNYYSLIRYSSSVNNIFDIDGSHIGYSTVITQHSNGSQEITKFTDINSNPDALPAQFDIGAFNGEQTSFWEVPSTGAPFTSRTSRSWERGLVKEYKVLNANNKPLSTKRNYYTAGGIIRSIQALKATTTYINGDPKVGYWYALYGKYQIESAMIFLIKSEEETYDQKSISNTIPKILTTTNYEYTFPNKLSKTTTSILGNPKKYITQLIYPEILVDGNFLDPDMDVVRGLKDIPTLALVNMYTKHITGEPVEKITYVQEGANTPLVTSAELTVFGNFPADPNDVFDETRALPAKKYVFTAPNGVTDFPLTKVKKTTYQTGGLNLVKYILDFDSRYKLVSSVDKYKPIKDDPLQVSTKDNYKTSYIWGYNDNLVIAQVANASLTQTRQIVNASQNFFLAQLANDTQSGALPVAQPTLKLDYAQSVTFTVTAEMLGSGSPAIAPYVEVSLKNMDGSSNGGFFRSFQFSGTRQQQQQFTVSLPIGEYQIYYKSNAIPNGNTDFQGVMLTITAPYQIEKYNYNVFHTSFEETTEGQEEAFAKTGRKSYRAGSYKLNIPTIAGQYIISWWEKTTNDNNWIYKEEIVTSNGSDMSRTISAPYIDEVRLYPIGALMTTYTYDPLIGLTSQTDPNSITTTYLYDAFGRLEYVKDSNGNIIKNYVYKLVTDPE
ncbi:RHS repeat domain-containing protein [Xanthocytophaga agilis]|uniref:RHS repeat protein n=1 Tax=Xanthocytophaga agilis TaxID=3048010 RepID=A0AAE3R5G4_9BACT|nr:RHS repeat domain-containing protein [Xanthocytophaga agilis]MDJ1503570.1 RHS repeat protein [Xanthocytophaga agilis]